MSRPFILEQPVENFKLPEGVENFDFIVAGNGLFLYKENLVCRVLYPVSLHTIPGVPQLNAWCIPTCKRMSYSFLEEAISFCRYGVEKRHGEVMLLLAMDREGNWKWIPPKEQICTHGSVKYDRDHEAENKLQLEEGLSVVGTMHSHCNMGGFFSGTDDKDDLFGFEGIHMVFGRVSQTIPELQWSITVGGYRFLAGKHFLKEDVIEGAPDIPELALDDWAKSIKLATYSYNYGRGSSYLGNQQKTLPSTAADKPKTSSGAYAKTPGGVLTPTGVGSSQKKGEEEKEDPEKKPGRSTVRIISPDKRDPAYEGDWFDGFCGALPVANDIDETGESLLKDLDNAITNGKLDSDNVRDISTFFDTLSLMLKDTADDMDDKDAEIDDQYAGYDGASMRGDDYDDFFESGGYGFSYYPDKIDEKRERVEEEQSRAHLPGGK